MEVAAVLILLGIGTPQLMDVQPSILAPMPVHLYSINVISAYFRTLTCGLSVFNAMTIPTALFVLGLVLMRWSCSITASFVRGMVVLTAVGSVVYLVEYRGLALLH